MKSQLISQEKFMARAREGKITISLFPVSFANGYFVEGHYKSGNRVYATIKKDYTKDLQSLLDAQGLNGGLSQ